MDAFGTFTLAVLAGAFIARGVFADQPRQAPARRLGADAGARGVAFNRG
jgi:hypothetical protein